MPEYSPGIASLFEVVARLRAPDGCPWDREQTHESLRPYLLEETYELLEAIDAGDDTKMKEELGDLLLQVAMHAEIASQESTTRSARRAGQAARTHQSSTACRRRCQRSLGRSACRSARRAWASTTRLRATAPRR